MTLFENRIFADIIKIRSYWPGVGPKFNDWYLYKREIWTEIHSEEGHLKTGRIWSDVALYHEYQGLLATARC